MFKGLGLPQIRTANAASRPSRIEDLLAGRLLLRRSSELLQPAFGDDQADLEPFGVPLPDNLAAELTLDRRPCKSGAEPLFVGRRDRRTAPLDPNELQRVAVISAFEIHVAGIRRKRPVFRGVCHELMDHERKAGHCVGGDWQVRPARRHARSSLRRVTLIRRQQSSEQRLQTGETLACPATVRRRQGKCMRRASDRRRAVTAEASSTAVSTFFALSATTLLETENRFFTRCAISRMSRSFCCSALLRSLMSRAIFEAPITTPSS